MLNLTIFPFYFSNLYLGETFSSYVCVQNNSSVMVKDVTVKVTISDLFRINFYIN